jgi:hypothetical protein
VRVGQKRTKKNDPVYHAQYREKHRERINTRLREYRKANPNTVVEAETDPRRRAARLVAYARQRARKRNIAFSLDPEAISAAVERGTCAVTGIPFVFQFGRGIHPLSPSIDRIDSSKGYVNGNVRVVLWAVNTACSTWGLEATLAIFAHALGVPNPSTTAVLARLQE